MVTEEVSAAEEAAEKLPRRSRHAETGRERQGDGRGVFSRRDGRQEAWWRGRVDSSLGSVRHGPFHR